METMSKEAKEIRTSNEAEKQVASVSAVGSNPIQSTIIFLFFLKEHSAVVHEFQEALGITVQRSLSDIFHSI